MTERPILFSGPMVRALLSGAKTQTRRVVKLRGAEAMEDHGGHDAAQPAAGPWPWSPELDDWAPSPYGEPGDALWVRETWAPHDQQTVRLRERASVYYRADDERRYDTDGRWRPSIHMPRWASRLTLEVTGVRVERLGDISEADARAEGVETEWTTEAGEHLSCTAREAFANLWNDINGAGSWAANPWVWVVEFKRVTP